MSLCTTVFYLLNIASKSSTNYKKREMKCPGTTSVKGTMRGQHRKSPFLTLGIGFVFENFWHYSHIHQLKTADLDKAPSYKYTVRYGAVNLQNFLRRIFLILDF